MKIAITGGVGSGKSTVTRLLGATLEAEVVDVDELCRIEMMPGEEGYQQFKALHGERFILQDGTLDRKVLREALFSEPKLKDSLEQILHPLVRSRVELLHEQRSNKQDLTLVEVPLLFEVGWHVDFDVIVVVYSSREECLERVMQRDGVSRSSAIAIVENQMPLNEKVEMADFVVNNSSIFCSTFLQVNWLNNALTDVWATKATLE